jgi:hypothetical protein
MIRQIKNSPNYKIPSSDIIEFGMMLLFFKFLTFITRFFPFSQFYTDRKFHYNNRKYVVFTEKIEDSVRALGKYIKIYFMERDNDYFYIFHARVNASLKRVTNGKMTEVIKK